MAQTNNEESSDEESIDNALLESLGESLGEDLGKSTSKDDDTKNDSDAKDQDADGNIKDPVLRIGERMRTAGKWMQDGESPEKVGDLQTKVIADLDKLIEQAKKQCSECKGGGKQSKPGKKKTPKPGKKKNTKPGKKPSSQPAKDSNDDLRNRGPDVLDQQEIEDLIKHAWGNLPPEHENAC